MPDARIVRDWDEQRITAGNAVAVGEIWQMADGSAGYYERLAGNSTNPVVAGSSGESTIFKTSGKVTVTKTTSIVILDGGRVYWDHSANSATYKKVNDRDFYIGRAVGDAASADASLVVDLNADPGYDIDLARDAHLSVVTGTQAVGAFGFPKRLGGSLSLELTATNEVQKVDALSVDGFDIASNAIVEIIFRVPDDGAGTAADLSLGVANATHGTDADSITEHLFVHLDANAADIFLQSKDTSTTVAATDTTINYTEGSAVANRVEVWMDFRNPADVQCYVNGALVLSATTFNLNAVVGPLFLLAHLEKTSSTDVYRAVVDALRVRFSEQ